MPKSNGTPETKNGHAELDIFASSETTTIYLDDEHRLWVELVNELDFGQQSELDAASLRGITMKDAEDAADKQQLMVFDLGHQRRLKLSIYIIDWGLPARWPTALKDRYDLVKRLKPKWAEAILREIERLEAAARGEDTEQAVADPNLTTGRPALLTAPEAP